VTPPRSGSGYQLAVGCGLALLSTVATLLFAEGTLRIYWLLRDAREQRALPAVEQRALVPSSDPALRWEWNPGFRRTDFSVNAFGMADDETSQGKPPGVFRIAFVGDSITANFELLPRADIYANQLERRLNADADRGGRFEALNFGVNGYGIRQTAHVLRTRVRRFDPDLVVLQLCLNDPYPSDSAYSREAPVGPSRLWNFLHRRLAPGRFWAWWYVERTYDPPGLANLRRAMQEVGEEARRGPPVVAVLFPYLYAPAYDRWGFGRYHALYREAAREAGLPMLDLYEPFRRAGFVGMWPPTADPIHPGREAHALAADALRAHLEALRMLPGRSGAPLAARTAAPEDTR